MGRPTARRVVHGPPLRPVGDAVRASRRALAGTGDDRRGTRPPTSAAVAVDGDGRDQLRLRSRARRRTLWTRQLALLPVRTEAIGAPIARPPHRRARGPAGRAPSASPWRI